MNNFTDEYEDEIIQHVNNSFIDPRDALHGGRTEVFKTFYKTKAPGDGLSYIPSAFGLGFRPLRRLGVPAVFSLYSALALALSLSWHSTLFLD